MARKEIYQMGRNHHKQQGCTERTSIVLENSIWGRFYNVAGLTYHDLHSGIQCRYPEVDIVLSLGRYKDAGGARQLPLT
jgi:hypothetical protein